MGRRGAAPPATCQQESLPSLERAHPMGPGGRVCGTGHRLLQAPPTKTVAEPTERIERSSPLYESGVVAVGPRRQDVLRGESGIRTHARLAPPTAFPGQPLQPLGYLSIGPLTRSRTPKAVFRRHCRRSATQGMVGTLGVEPRSSAYKTEALTVGRRASPLTENRTQAFRLGGGRSLH